MLKKKRFLIGGLIIGLAVIFLGYMGFISGASYYYEVGELLDLGSSVYDQALRVNGEVAPGVVKEAKELTLRFTIIDTTGRDASLPVVYRGVVPDTFKVGNQVVVEGKYIPDGIFEATAIQTKCASKYLPAS
ncbi:MAG: cytochrome c maturation protein CcmE [Dehalococcoidales bacterium]